MTNLVTAMMILGGSMMSAHFNWQLQVRDQVRGGDAYVSNRSPRNTQTVSEIIAPSAQVRATFFNNQDLMLRYQPQMMNTYMSAQFAGGAGGWNGWSMLHRVNATYNLGRVETFRLTSIFNLTIGKLDTFNSDTLVDQSGLLPGVTGSLINYTNTTATVGVERLFARHWHLATQETIGLIKFPGGIQSIDFEYNPTFSSNGSGGSSEQLKALSRNTLSYDVNDAKSFNVMLELSDVSYADTATFFGIAPTLGFANAFNSLSNMTLRLGAMRYWTNPYPGVVEKSHWLAIFQFMLEHTFTNWGLPHLKGHLELSLLPFYNLQFSNLEPRTSVLGQLAYQFTRAWSLNGSLRFFTSEYWNFGHMRRLQRGHPQNIVIVNLSARYYPTKWIGIDFGGYISNRSFITGVQQPYRNMTEFYGLFGLTGTWQVD